MKCPPLAASEVAVLRLFWEARSARNAARVSRIRPRGRRRYEGLEEQWQAEAARGNPPRESSSAWSTAPARPGSRAMPISAATAECAPSEQLNSRDGPESIYR